MPRSGNRFFLKRSLLFSPRLYPTGCVSRQQKLETSWSWAIITVMIILCVCHVDREDTGAPARKAGLEDPQGSRPGKTTTPCGQAPTRGTPVGAIDRMQECDYPASSCTGIYANVRNKASPSTTGWPHGPGQSRSSSGNTSGLRSKMSLYRAFLVSLPDVWHRVSNNRQRKISRSSRTPPRYSVLCEMWPCGVKPCAALMLLGKLSMRIQRIRGGSDCRNMDNLVGDQRFGSRGTLAGMEAEGRVRSTALTESVYIPCCLSFSTPGVVTLPVE